MTINWAEQFVVGLDGVTDALEDHERTFGEPVVGPINFGSLSFPAAHVIPESIDYQGGNEYLHQTTVNHYFERDKRTDYSEHVLDVADAVGDVLESLGSNPLVVEFKLTNVEFFVASQGSNLLTNIATTYRVKTLADFAE